jgi:hypothetical protein
MMVFYAYATFALQYLNQSAGAYTVSISKSDKKMHQGD